jgi:hypothetical protein
VASSSPVFGRAFLRGMPMATKFGQIFHQQSARQAKPGLTVSCESGTRPAFGLAEAGRGEVGFLVVHGIGDQKPGETLRAYGLPIALYAEERSIHGGVAVKTTSIEAGAEAAVEFTDSTGAGNRWLIRESWWSGEIEPPGYRTIAIWLCLVAPWMLLREATQWPVARGILGPGRATRWIPVGVLLIWYLWFWEFTLLALPILHVLLVLSVLIGSLLGARGGLRRLGRLVSRSVGDAYAYIQRDTDHQRVVNKVTVDIHALARRVDALVVVAHSQGAALVREALAGRPPPPQLRAVVALGAGIDKLSVLQRQRAFLAWPVIWTVVAWTGLIAFALSSFETIPGGLVFGALLVALILVWRERRRPSPLEGMPGLGSSWGWNHVFATRDPVPDGIRRLPAGVTPVPVVNQHSWIRDHTSYMANRAQVVAGIYHIGVCLTHRIRSPSEPGTSQITDYDWLPSRTKGCVKARTG